MPDDTRQNGPMVIIGAGQAGFAATEKLRNLGHDGPVAADLPDPGHEPA